MSQLADCKSMLISAERRSDTWKETLTNLNIVLETMEIFLDCKSIVNVLEEIKAYYSRDEFKEQDIKRRMNMYLEDKLYHYQYTN